MKGQAFLSLVFLIGGVVMIAGMTLAFFSTAFIDSGYGYQAATNADAAAASGAQDALLQLARNEIFSSTSYTIAVGSTTATVSVTQSSPSLNFVTVSSTATSALRTRTVKVVAFDDPNTGQITVTSWQSQ